MLQLFQRTSKQVRAAALVVESAAVLLGKLSQMPLSLCIELENPARHISPVLLYGAVVISDDAAQHEATIASGGSPGTALSFEQHSFQSAALTQPISAAGADNATTDDGNINFFRALVAVVVQPIRDGHKQKPAGGSLPLYRWYNYHPNPSAPGTLPCCCPS